jgi:hypothetical protein
MATRQKGDAMDRLKYLVIVAAVAAVVLVYWLNPGVIQFKKYSAADFTQQLAPLVLIALFIERSLEVFITVWRGGKASELQRAVEKAKALPDGPDKVDKVQTADDELAKYRFETQKIALPSALILGILIASLGVRGLGNFADLDKLMDQHSTQRYLFNVADVLLTGALMGGGSDFMHKIITTFTDLMDATSQKAKGSTP